MSGFAGGLCLTFDDASVDDWFAADALFARYRARATFFVSHFHTLAPDAVEKLRELARRGHEIGHHTVNHADATAFLERGGTPEGYIAAEVMPALDRMHAAGLAPTAFCYPFNRRNDALDAHMLRLFKVVRTRSEDAPGGLHAASDNRLLRAFSIDLHVQGTTVTKTLRDLEEALALTCRANQVLVTYGHRISNQPVAHHHITAWGLECMLHAASSLGLHFHTASELA